MFSDNVTNPNTPSEMEEEEEFLNDVFEHQLLALFERGPESVTNTTVNLPPFGMSETVQGAAAPAAAAAAATGCLTPSVQATPPPKRKDNHNKGSSGATSVFTITNLQVNDAVIVKHLEKHDFTPPMNKTDMVDFLKEKYPGTEITETAPTSETDMVDPLDKKYPGTKTTETAKTAPTSETDRVDPLDKKYPGTKTTETAKTAPTSETDRVDPLDKKYPGTKTTAPTSKTSETDRVDPFDKKCPGTKTTETASTSKTSETDMVDSLETKDPGTKTTAPTSETSKTIVITIPFILWNNDPNRSTFSGQKLLNGIRQDWTTKNSEEPDDSHIKLLLEKFKNAGGGNIYCRDETYHTTDNTVVDRPATYNDIREYMKRKYIDVTKNDAVTNHTGRSNVPGQVRWKDCRDILYKELNNDEQATTTRTITQEQAKNLLTDFQPQPRILINVDKIKRSKSLCQWTFPDDQYIWANEVHIVDNFKGCKGPDSSTKNKNKKTNQKKKNQKKKKNQEANSATTSSSSDDILVQNRVKPYIAVTLKAFVNHYKFDLKRLEGTSRSKTYTSQLNRFQKHLESLEKSPFYTETIRCYPIADDPYGDQTAHLQVRETIVKWFMTLDKPLPSCSSVARAGSGYVPPRSDPDRDNKGNDNRKDNSKDNANSNGGNDTTTAVASSSRSSSNKKRSPTHGSTNNTKSVRHNGNTNHEAMDEEDSNDDSDPQHEEEFNDDMGDSEDSDDDEEEEEEEDDDDNDDSWPSNSNKNNSDGLREGQEAGVGRFLTTTNEYEEMDEEDSSNHDDSQSDDEDDSDEDDDNNDDDEFPSFAAPVVEVTVDLQELVLSDQSTTLGGGDESSGTHSAGSKRKNIDTDLGEDLLNTRDHKKSEEDPASNNDEVDTSILADEKRSFDSTDSSNETRNSSSSSSSYCIVEPNDYESPAPPESLKIPPPSFGSDGSPDHDIPGDEALEAVQVLSRLASTTTTNQEQPAAMMAPASASTGFTFTHQAVSANDPPPDSIEMLAEDRMLEKDVLPDRATRRVIDDPKEKQETKAPSENMEQEDDYQKEKAKNLAKVRVRVQELEKAKALAKVRLDGRDLKNVPKRFRGDKEVVLAAVQKNGFAIENASPELRADKEVVLEACQNWPWALQYASDNVKADKEVVLAICQKYGWVLEYASLDLRADKEVVSVACQNTSFALQYAFKNLQADKDVVLEAVQKDGGALQYASDDLQADKDVVKEAVASNPDALKFAKGGLNQGNTGRDCLIASGVWLADTRHTGPKIVLSTRFSLKPDSHSQATLFAALLNQECKYIRKRDFGVYWPNTFAGGTCGKEWARSSWPCRGTLDTCEMEDSLKMGIPQPGCCWRYSFRYQLETAKESNGCMIQLVEDEGRGNERGNGQEIEDEMAKEVGIKVFRVGGDHVDEYLIDVVVEELRHWYEDKCKDMSDCFIEHPARKKYYDSRSSKKYKHDYSRSSKKYTSDY